MTTSEPSNSFGSGAVMANVLCSLSMLLWAVGLPAAETLLPRVPALPLAAARLTLSALFLLPIWWALEGSKSLRQAGWGRGILVGGTGFALGAYLMTLGQSLTGPVTVAVISATLPIYGIALEVVFDKRRITLGLIIGLLLSLIGGVAVVVGKPDGEGLHLGLGALFCFASVFSFTLGSRWAVTFFPGVSPMGRTTVTLSGAAICIAIAALINAAMGGAGPDWSALGWPDLAALLFYSVSGMAISQLLWILSIGRLGIGVAAMHINLTPFYVMLIVFALGGVWSWTQVASAVIVSLGVLIAQGLIPLPKFKGQPINR